MAWNVLTHHYFIPCWRALFWGSRLPANGSGGDCHFIKAA
jgi:hypothetical protein